MHVDHTTVQTASRSGSGDESAENNNEEMAEKKPPSISPTAWPTPEFQQKRGH